MYMQCRWTHSGGNGTQSENAAVFRRKSLLPRILSNIFCVLLPDSYTPSLPHDILLVMATPRPSFQPRPGSSAAPGGSKISTPTPTFGGVRSNGNTNGNGNVASSGGSGIKRKSPWGTASPAPGPSTPSHPSTPGYSGGSKPQLGSGVKLERRDDIEGANKRIKGGSAGPGGYGNAGLSRPSPLGGMYGGGGDDPRTVAMDLQGQLKVGRDT